jgi:hypothetical protein
MGTETLLCNPSRGALNVRPPPPRIPHCRKLDSGRGHRSGGAEEEGDGGGGGRADGGASGGRWVVVAVAELGFGVGGGGTSLAIEEGGSTGTGRWCGEATRGGGGRRQASDALRGGRTMRLRDRGVPMGRGQGATRRGAWRPGWKIL